MGIDRATTASGERRPERLAYGDEPLQHVLLRRPVGRGSAGTGTLLLFHGGSWRAGVGSGTLGPLAARFRASGWVTAEAEYRTVGAGGGWPTTFDDAGLAVARVAQLADDGLLPSPLVALGHSAGGTLAVWLAVSGGSRDVRVAGAVSLAGVLDLRGSAQVGLIDGAVADLLGGTPTQVPDRYRQADPGLLLAGARPGRLRLVHGRQDDAVPPAQSRAFAIAAATAGWDVRLDVVDADHMGVIDPDGPAWPAVREAVTDLGTAG